MASARGRGMIARGLARSYGDAAQNAGGSVVSALGLNRVVDVDLDRRPVTVEAGVSLDRLMRLLLPLGLFPMVTPGTRKVTVGGAIASDIHGKNHHVDGSFCRHVERMVLATPALGRIEVSPDDESEVFWATAGGMGLTGMVLEATIAMLAVETSRMRVDTERIADLDTAHGPHARLRRPLPLLGGVDRLPGLGPAAGPLGADPGRPRPRRRPAPRRPIAASGRWRFTRPSAWPRRRGFPAVCSTGSPWPRSTSSGSARRPAAKRGGSNRSPASSTRSTASNGWNRLYGRPGFLQYQMVVPYGAEDALRTVMEALSRARCASFLAVLKRFGAANPGPLSFPLPGWTLALDIPAGGAELGALLDRLDGVVADAGGRVYLAKDSRMRPELLPVMYPELSRWQKVRDELDPKHRLRSDLARRLWPLEATRGAGVKDALGAVQTIVVLGGASEIGVAIAGQLARPRHATVVLAGRHPEALRGVRSAAGASGRRPGGDRSPSMPTTPTTTTSLVDKVIGPGR